MTDAPLCLLQERIRPEWLDINQHLNVAFYARLFDQAAEAFMALVGVDDTYIRERGLSWAVLESHATFSRELVLEDPVRVWGQVLDADAKRVHLFQTLCHADQGFQAATQEQLILHLDLGARRSCPFPSEVARRLAALTTAHQELPRPPELGRVIGLRRR